MDLDQLRCVLAIIQEKTYLDAAERLHRSQSSVSKSVRKLEEELGVEIFERTTRRVRLTPAGEDVMYYAAKILEDADGLYQSAEYHRTANQRDLRIGSIYFGMNNRLVPLLAEFMKQYPAMNVTMEESTTTPLLQRLEQRELDVVFVSSMYLQNGEHKNFSGDPRYISCSFSIDPYFVFVNRSHPLAGKKLLTYADLEGQRLITTDKTMDVYHTAIRSTLEAYGVHVSIATYCTNVRSVLHMVSQNVGIAILSKLVIEESDELVTIPLENPLIRDTQMVIRKQRTVPPHIHAFYQFIQTKGIAPPKNK
ncbi:MAG: LysR family transcriptional regulator [Oscillospiraceae bacterium]|nr:LysR family transcriptional regulator [Oscillospiraceae bacterium]